MKPAPFNSVNRINVQGREYSYYDLGALERAGLCEISTLPFSIRVLLENALRNAHDGPRD